MKLSIALFSDIRYNHLKLSECSDEPLAMREIAKKCVNKGWNLPSQKTQRIPLDTNMQKVVR